MQTNPLMVMEVASLITATTGVCFARNYVNSQQNELLRYLLKLSSKYLTKFKYCNCRALDLVEVHFKLITSSLN